MKKEQLLDRERNQIRAVFQISVSTFSLSASTKKTQKYNKFNLKYTTQTPTPEKNESNPVSSNHSHLTSSSSSDPSDILLEFLTSDGGGENVGIVRFCRGEGVGEVVNVGVVEGSEYLLGGASLV